MLLYKELRVKLLRSCEDELRRKLRPPDQLTINSTKPVKIQLLKRSLSDDVSGEEACGCIQAASMHVAIKLQSHIDA
jgi:hypothetical protein